MLGKGIITPVAPIPQPTTEPAPEPAVEPTPSPTTVPTAEPTSVPIDEPAPQPTAEPVPQPVSLKDYQPVLIPLVLALIALGWFLLARRRRWIIFINDPQEVEAGKVSSIFVVQMSDSRRHPFYARKHATLVLSTSSATGRFDLRANGDFSQETGSVTIPKDDYRAKFYYLDTAAGEAEITVTVKDQRGWKKGKQKISIIPDPLAESIPVMRVSSSRYRGKAKLN